MNSRRLAIVTSRFWPIFGLPQMVAADLAIGFQKLGHDVEIFTTRWEHRWSKSFSFRGVPVSRIPAASNGPWGNFRSHRVLTRQLQSGDFDGVLLFGLEGGLEAVVAALGKTKTKIVLRLDDSVSPQALWAKDLGKKTLAALQSVDAIVCTAPVLQQRLLATEVDNENLTVIPDGTPQQAGQQKTQNEQSLARMALSEAHPVFAIERDQPLVVTGVPLNGDAGIFDLVQAWKKVVRQMPKARLWIMGDGPQGKRLWSMITSENLVYSAIMPGFIDCLDDLFAAADLYVHPARDEVGQAYMTRALASGICPVTTDDLNGRIRDGVSGKVVAKQDPTQMASTIIELFKNSVLRNELGYAARMSVAASLPIEATIASYLSLLSGLPCPAPISSCEPIP